MLRPLLSVLLALFGATAVAQDDNRLLAAFDKAFAVPKPGREGPPAEEMRAALAALSGLDSGKVAETLAGGWSNLETELSALDAQRNEMTAEMAKLIEGQEASESRRLPQASLARFRELKERTAKLRDRADELRKLQQEVGERIAGLGRRDSLLFLLQKVCGHKKAPLPLQLAAGRALGRGVDEVLPELAAALARAKQPIEQVVLLDAMLLAGKRASVHATPVIELLSSKEDAVAERAAQALSRLAVVEAVEPMIALLARSDGQMRMRVASALEVLTTQQFGENVGAWQSWWKAEGAAFAAGGTELGSGVPSHRAKTNEFYYFGIPQDRSESILYVIDCSGSMKATVKLDTGVSIAGEKIEETTRLEGCQIELSRALGKLKPNQKFAILWFNDLPHWWEPKLQPATPDAIARAQQFVAQLKPASSTNIHDSLEQAFTLVGRGARDKYYGVEIDTIFLLTDGSPTTPNGKLDSTDEILTSVRAWNPLKRVTIHCIAIGKDLNAAFLRQLASENGGEFKQF